MIANEHQRAAMKALGEGLLDLVEGFSMEGYQPSLDRLLNSQRIARLALVAMLDAGGDRELNRVSMIEGVAAALGEMIAQQTPENYAFIAEKFSQAFTRGAQSASATFEPRGHA